MIEEQAVVVAIEGDDILVETQKQSVCGQCVVNKGCGTAVMQKVLGRKRNRLRVTSRITVSIGDHVIIAIKEHAIVRGTIIIYMLPLLMMIMSGIGGRAVGVRLSLSDPDVLSIIFALCGFALGFLIARHVTGMVVNDPNYRPMVLSKSLFQEQV